MSFDIGIKIFGVVVTMLSAWKLARDIYIGRKTRLKEDYRFAKDFLHELKDNPGLHPFVIEKGYHAIAGSTILKPEEIAYLISLDSPAKCLRDFTLARKNLEIVNKYGVYEIIFSRNCSVS